MIRRATFGDVPAIFGLLLQMQRESKFYPDVDVDEPTARALVVQSIQRNGGSNQGSTIVLVEDIDGEIHGFMIGILDRVYHIGNRLVANDLFLYATKKARSRAALEMMKAYVAWAEKNPKVAKIMLSWTDALGADNQRIEQVYTRLGFARVGGIFEKDGAA